jgi:hypothetical protein
MTNPPLTAEELHAVQVRNMARARRALKAQRAAAKKSGGKRGPHKKRAPAPRGAAPSLAAQLRTQARRMKQEAIALQRRAHALLAAARLVGRG